MDFITDLMRQISVIAVLAAFLELLLPNGEMQKFIRFFMGLLILVAFLNPFIKGQLFDGKTALAEIEETLEGEQPRLSTEEILAAGEKMDNALLNKAGEEIKEEVTLQILALVRLAPGVEQASAEITFAADGSGSIAAAQLAVIVSGGTDAARTEQAIYELLEAFYHIPQEKIQCVIKEATANDNN